jgi:uncharacterized protein YfbU (UPF0304 family)
MAVLNVRIDDDHHGLLKQQADKEGISLSEFIRGRLLAAVVPVDEREQPERARDDVTPASLTPVERQSLALLHRILARVLPEDSNLEDGDAKYQLERAKVLEEGFVGDYHTEFAGIRPELTAAQSSFVLDVLDMFRILTFSIQKLDKESPKVKDTSLLEFQGFDHNDVLEGHMATFVEYLMDDRGLWKELHPQKKASDDGNSHSQMIDVYQRMLTEYRRIKDARRRGHGRFDYHLGFQELEQIANAAIHPSNRR